MTPTRLRFPQFLPFSERPSLSMQLMVVGLIITLFFVLIAIFAPAFQAWGWLQNPTESLSNPIHEPPGVSNPIHEPPGVKHWFGTTNQGYDVFSRTVFGSQAALQVVILATTLSLIIGVPLGLVRGYLGGVIDRILLFFMDTIYTLPGLLLSVTLAFVVGRGILNAAIALFVGCVLTHPFIILLPNVKYLKHFTFKSHACSSLILISILAASSKEIHQKTSA